MTIQNPAPTIASPADASASAVVAAAAPAVTTPAVQPAQGAAIQSLPPLKCGDRFDYEMFGQVYRSPYVEWKWENSIEGVVTEIQLTPKYRTDHTEEHLNRNLTAEEYARFYDVCLSINPPNTSDIRFVKNDKTALKKAFAQFNIQQGDYVKIRLTRRPVEGQSGSYAFEVEKQSPVAANTASVAPNPASMAPSDPF